MLFVRTRITVELVFLLVLSTLYLKTNARENDEKRENTNKITDRWRRFAQKKARSASFAVLPQYLYSRQTVPVRLASVPAGPYRLLGARRLNNVASLAASPGIRRTYLPAVASIPRVQYPAIVQQAAAPRYVIPYRVQPSAPVATTNDIFAKHYNEKYNTLPSISTADVANQDGASLTKKVEEKHMVLGDEFDNLMDSLDGPCAKNPCKHDAKCRMTRGGSSYFCVCTRGYKGKHCEDKNPCYPNPCDNNGECTLTRAGFECSCPRGFKGKTCEQRSKCEPNPCHNDGMCNELKNGAFECTCKKGYFGDKCQVTKKGCEPNPCHNEARCTEVGGDGGYQCACMDSYSGKNCEIMENKCQINPCKNGGSCLSTMTSQGYECSCPQGYRGQNCQDHSGCDLTSCGNGGTCYETEFGVRCICKNGYSGDTCQVRKLCDADTCQNNGKCIEHANGFYCKCSDGYRGKTCEEMDRCRPNPCLHNGECVQSDTGYICKCRPQYQGENCEVQNPCSENPCKNGGQCLSTSIGGEYQCQCFGGYLGKNCEEHDACEVNPCENNGVCRRNGNGFICDCKEGYRGETCQRSNPCRLNPCQNGGSCQQTNDHDYVCLCHKDFKGLHCEAKKPCRLNPCLNDGVCEENEDDFKCSCRRGYKGRKCDEIDECVLNPCKNGGRCTSISHSASNGRRYSCECINNYYGDNCQERSPCHPNPCANNGQCASMNGGFVCQCMAGFKGDRCQEINRCSPNPCQHDGSCTEVIGGTGYACKCAYGYKGGDCEHKDYCHPNPCDHDSQCTPLDDGEGFQCKCSSGYRGQRCSEVDPCQPNPCHHKSQCIVLPGFGPSHECNCTIGWSGETCQKREICQPNPCQFGTKCMETGEDSYSCVKSMCHPNPCQNDGKCINVNENNFQCACSEQYEGTICEGDDNLPTNQRNETTDEGRVRSFSAKPATQPKTTKIDKLLKLIDTTLQNYNVKQSTVNTENQANKVTKALVKTFEHYQNDDTNDNGINTNTNDYTVTLTDGKQQNVGKNTDNKNNPTLHDKTPEITDDNLAKMINPNGEVFVDKPEISTILSDNARKRQNIRNNTDNEYKPTQQADNPDNPDISDDNLAKMINPDGEVVIDKPETSTILSDNDRKRQNVRNNTNNPTLQDENPDITDDNFAKKINPDGEVVIDKPETSTILPDQFPSVQRNKATTTTPQTDKQTDLENNIMNEIHDEEQFVKRINPDGQVIITPDQQVPRRLPVALPHVPKAPAPPSPASYRQPERAGANNVPTYTRNQMVPTPPSINELRRPLNIPMNEIASCSPLLCQNGGVCIQEAGRPIRCKCKPRYTGETCEASKCTNDPCRNGGTCVSIEKEPGFVCKCRDGLTGPMCSRKPCEPNPCKNGGDCVVFYSVYLCKCKPGYTGKLCEDEDRRNVNIENINNDNLYNDHNTPNKNVNANSNINNHDVDINHDKSNNHIEQLNNDKPANINNNPDNTVNNLVNTNTNVNSNSGNSYNNMDKNIDNSNNINNDNDNPADNYVSNDNDKLNNDINNNGNDAGNNIDTDNNYLNNNKNDDNINTDNNSNGNPNNDMNSDNNNGNSKEDINNDNDNTNTDNLDNNINNDKYSNKNMKNKDNLINNIYNKNDNVLDNNNSGNSNSNINNNNNLVINDGDIHNNNNNIIEKSSYSNKNPDIAQNIYNTDQQPQETNKPPQQLLVTGPSKNAKAYAGVKDDENDSEYMENALITNSGGSSPPQTPMAITGEVRDKGNGQNMETIMDNQSSACVSSPCENEARCLDSAEGDFQCICSQDFSGPRCEDKGAYKYSSAPKFFPGENEECKHCDANARCVNGHCICRNDYVGDGLECWKQTQRDKQWSCDTNPCQNGGTCKPGISRCVCRLGFTGQYCEDFRPPVVHLTFDQITDGNKVLDDSGNGNDAGVFNGFQIAKGGKCKNAGNLLGGDVLFDGANFKGIPREAITISVWLKLTTTRGIQSIFDTIGSHSSHKDGQYHFEIDDGRVRWFHRNERKQTVFSVVTDDSVVDENEWVLVTGTYSAKQHRSRVYVNGDMMKENSVQQLLLSGDWGAKAGIATMTELDVPTTEDENKNEMNYIHDSSLINNDHINNNNNKYNNNDDDNNIYELANADDKIINKRNNINRKHKHTYGTRVLRGMVDEFYIFPSELSRLQILVLMKHCKIYYNHVPQVLKNSQPETFTELPPVVTMALGPVAQYTSPPSQRMTSPQYARKTSSGPYEYVKPTASAQAMWPAPGQVYAQQNGPANQPGTSPYTTPVAQQGFQRSQTSTQLKSPGTAVNTRPVYQFVQPPIKQYAPGFSDTITQAQVNGRPQYQNIPTHSPPPARYQNVPIHSPPPARYQNVPTHSPPPATYQNVPTHSPPPATYQNVPIHSPPPATYQGYNTPRYPTKPKSSQYGDYGSATKPHSRTQTPGNAYVQNELQPRNGQQTGVGRMQVSQSPPTSVTGYPASYQSSQMPSARTYKTYAPTSSGQGYANYQAPKTSWEASNKAPVEGTARNSQPENVGASYTRQNRPVAPPQPYQGVKANSGYNNVQHSYLPQADSKVQYNKITNTPEYQRYTSDQSKAWQINHVTSTGKAKPVSYITNPWSQNGNTRSNVNNNNNRAYKNANIAYKPHTYGSTNTVDQSEVHSPATSSSLYSTPTNSYQQTGVNGAQRQGIQQPNSASSSLYSTPTTNSYQQTGVNSAQRQGIPQQNSVPTTNTYQQNPGANGVQRQGIQQPNLASSSSYNTPTTNSFQQTPPGISGAQRQSTPQPNSASFPAQRQAIQHANSPSASLYNKPPTTNTYQQAPSGVNGVQRQETPQQNSVPTTNTYQQSTDANGAQRQGIQQPNSGSSSSYNTPTTNNYQQTLSSVGGAQRQKTPQPNSATTIKSTQPALARAQNMAITVPSGQLNKPISNQLDRYGQYPDNGEQYARSRVQNNNKQSPVAAYGSNYATPAPMQQGTTYPTQSGTGSTAQYGARQWNSYVPKTKKSTVGRRPTYNTAYTVRRGRQWRRTNNSTPNQHLVQRLAREKVTPSLSRTGTLAKSIAVDIPNIYKRTITKDRHTAPRALS